MGSRLVPVLGLLLLLPALTGCLGTPGGSPLASQSTGALPSTAVGAASGVATQAAAVTAAHAYGFQGPAVRTVRSWHGAFAPNQAVLTGGCFVGSSCTRTFNLAGLAPVGRPVVVQANLTYGRGLTNDVQLSLDAGGASVYGYHTGTSFQNGTATLLATLVANAGSQPTLNVTMLLPPTGTKQTFTLTATVVADPSVVPRGVPTAVPVTADDGGFTLQAPGANSSTSSPLSALVWGPADGFLGNLTDANGTLVVNAAAMAGTGTYVVVVASARGAHVTPLQVNQSAPFPGPRPLRALQERATLGPAHAYQGGNLVWTTGLKVVPIRVGAYLQGGPGPSEVQAPNLTVSSAAGPVFVFHGTGTWVSSLGPTARSFWVSSAAPPNLANPLSFAFHGSSSQGTVAVGVVTVSYVR